MKREEKWEFKYEVPDKGIRVCYPQSKEQIEKNKKDCEKVGLRIISIKKLYPFSTMKNQHNFDLICSLTGNRMDDMICGTIEYDADEYEKLEEMRKKAEEFFCLPLPIAWLPWEQYKEAKELAEMAIIHRQNACIKAGRYDLVKDC